MWNQTPHPSCQVPFIFGKKQIMIKDFEDIVSWQKAQDLTFEVYTLFKNIRDYSFRDQIQRA